MRLRFEERRLPKFTVSLEDAERSWHDQNAKSDAWFAKGPNAAINDALIDDLKRRAIASGKNTRISLHPDPDHTLHEMIIVQHREKFHPPKKHSDKDKSFTIIEGRMAVFVFAADGTVEDVCVIGAGGNRQYRVGAGVIHADFPVTDMVVHFETTLGPFLGEEDSIFPDWAPAKGDISAGIAYRDALFAQWLDAPTEFLVTGAGGRAGGAIAEHLAAAGYSVTAQTRASAGDLAVSAFIPPGTKTVVHCAAELSVPTSSATGIARNNVAATRNMIDAALEARAEQFLFFSAMGVYGQPGAPVVTEATPITNPGAYGASKLLGEQMLAEVAEQLPSISFRLPAIVGAGVQPNWLSRTVEKLRANEPVHFINPENDFNNAVHMDDLANFIVNLHRQPLRGAHVINLASADTMPVGELVERLKAELGSSSELTSEARPEQPGFTIDCNLAGKKYGWQPMSMAALLARLAA